jgi:hypothetical protein
MKYLVAFLLSVGVASASELGAAHDIILFGEQSIAAGQTNTVETTYRVTGVFRQAAVWQIGSGASTTVVHSVRNGIEYPLATRSLSGAGVTKLGDTALGIFNEIIRFTTVNYGTNTITVIPAIIYEK